MLLVFRSYLNLCLVWKESNPAIHKYDIVFPAGIAATNYHRIQNEDLEGETIIRCCLKEAPNVHRLAPVVFWFLDVREKPEVGVANAPADGA